MWKIAQTTDWRQVLPAEQQLAFFLAIRQNGNFGDGYLGPLFWFLTIGFNPDINVLRATLSEQDGIVKILYKL